ncbi:hypothetical protein [Streptomyces sp. NPDC047981]|uniref:hypothetical protein n=1 Tax=Streptomyces sp. NPDC047981 TaxID=3154610 RepID=UPI00341864BD
MADRRTHEIMAAFRGGDILNNEIQDEEPQGDAASIEIRRRAGLPSLADERRAVQTRVRNEREAEAAKARFEARVAERARAARIDRAQARAQIGREDADQRREEEQRASHEQMVESGRAERRQELQELTAPSRVKYGPDGKPAPGTTVNDLIADGARGDSTVRKLRLAWAPPSYDDLVALGLVEPSNG